MTLSSVRATAPSTVPGSGGTNETIPDTTGGNSYVLRADNLCLPNAAPLAGLTGTPTSGVRPLAVNFNGSTSSDEDAIDHIATYTFNFGDGSDDVAQSTPTISHNFPDAGLYDVKLVVTDSRGKVSSNTAHQLIDVQLPPPPPVKIGLSASPTKVSEGGSATFTITATPAPQIDLTIPFVMDGKATSGADYTLSNTTGHATLAAGQSSVTVRLNAIQDNVKEKAEQAKMTLQSGTGYNFGGTKKKPAVPNATVTIQDVDKNH
jgi:PKD repeat protein